MIRDAELEEMQRQWAGENERIMREHPVSPSIPSLLDDGYETAPPEEPVVPQPPAEEPVAEAAEPVRRLRRGSELDEGSVP